MYFKSCVIRRCQHLIWTNTWNKQSWFKNTINYHPSSLSLSKNKREEHWALQWLTWQSEFIYFISVFVCVQCNRLWRNDKVWFWWFYIRCVVGAASLTEAFENKERFQTSEASGKSEESWRQQGRSRKTHTHTPRHKYILYVSYCTFFVSWYNFLNHRSWP